MNIEVNNNFEILNNIKNANDENLLKMCENDALLFGVVKAFLNSGFITTSSSKGHNYDTWKDPVYIAVYVDKLNICKVLNIIKKINDTLEDDDKKLLSYSFNYNSVKEENAYNIEYMFGIQIDLFEESEQRERILKGIENCLQKAENKSEIMLDYNFIYIVNRFINYTNENTNWINISFNANNLKNGFSLIFKKKQSDKGVLEKDYSFKSGIEEFEYLMNY